MKIISHRGNLDGPDLSIENSPAQIDKCISLGYDVEVDLRMKNGIPVLGHDYGQYEVSLSWIRNRASNLLIHVKEFDALVWLQENIPNSRFFCHQNDDFTIVSDGFIWVHNLNVKVDDKCIIPLISQDQLKELHFMINKVKAICTDHVYELQDLMNRNENE
jgi:hypothetical protein